MKNLLVFDSSTKNILFGGTVKGGDLFHCINLERSKMSRDLPVVFKEIFDKIDISIPVEIFIGNGPGPFTGLKTANSFFLGFLYSKGIKKVHLASSFKIISALTPSDEKLNKLAVIPFNKDEFFLGLLDKDNNILVKDVFIKESAGNIKDIFQEWGKTEVELILGSDCGTVLVENLKDIFHIKTVYQEEYRFDPERILSMKDSKDTDIAKEPFILNHVINPADIDKNCNIYVSNNFEEG